MLTRRDLSDAFEAMINDNPVPPTDEAEGRKLLEDTVLDVLIEKMDSVHGREELLRVRESEA